MQVTKTLFLATTMIAAPALGVLAQPANPTGDYGSNRSVTASPGTADSQAASGMHTGDVGSSSNAYSPTRPTPPTSGNRAAANPYKPGATGNTVVPGDNSSMANNGPATRNTQTQGATSGGNR